MNERYLIYSGNTSYSKRFQINTVAWLQGSRPVKRRLWVQAHSGENKL